MKRLALFFLWTFLFLAAFLAIDQLMVRVEIKLPVIAEVRTFYVDFRTRLLHLIKQTPHPKVQPAERKGPPPPATVKKEKPAPSKQAAVPSGKASSPRYFYADTNGELHFADSLDEVPAAYRKEAQPLER